jgi:DNA-binding transcriptional ArsR family regulator
VIYRRGMAGDERTIDVDARTLRAIAHPLRMRMLGILRTEGPATATSLAARLGESSGTTSWHLRQLAEHGFIEEDTERGSRRDRWWRAAHEFTRVRPEEFLDDPENAGAVAAFLFEAMSIYYRQATNFIANLRSWNREWVKAADMSDFQLSLTAPELTELRKELHEVVGRHTRGRKPDDEAVRVQLQLFPRRQP